MDRAAIRTLAKHWRWEKDREGLAWLTFDKQGESANTFSRQALEELSAVLHEIRGENPKGLIIRSAKPGIFIAGAVGFKQPCVRFVVSRISRGERLVAHFPSDSVGVVQFAHFTRSPLDACGSGETSVLVCVESRGHVPMAIAEFVRKTHGVLDCHAGALCQIR